MILFAEQLPLSTLCLFYLCVYVLYILVHSLTVENNASKNLFILWRVTKVPERHPKPIVCIKELRVDVTSKSSLILYFKEH